MTRSETWLLSEWRVARDRVYFHDEALMGHRLQTPFAEIDLLFSCSKTQSLSLLEVKSVGRDFIERALTQKQQRRLEQAAVFLEDKYSRPVTMILGVVGRELIQYFDLENSAIDMMG